MQRSDQPAIELNKARVSCDAMRSAENLEELEEHWKVVLHRLERTWNKIQHHYKKSPKWDAWHGKYLNLRKKDELLSYLVNARGCDEHTVDNIVSRTLGGISFEPSDGKPAHIKNISMVNGELFVDASPNLLVERIPPELLPKSVLNRGRIYPSPVAHLGKILENASLIDCARLGIEFYASVIESAENYFVK